VQGHERRIRTIELLTDLDRYLDVLDMAADRYVAQVNLFRNQRAEIELGHLTRHLLTESQLKDILQEASTNHQVSGKVEWHYQYLNVVPLSLDNGSLLYKIEIPLVAPRPYLLYKIVTHYVPINESFYAIKVLLHDEYAMDTVSGNLFIPRSCLGHDPRVCQAGVEYGQEAMQCPRALLTGRHDMVKTCKVKIGDVSGEPLIKATAVNEYVVATPADVWIVRCPGAQEHHVTVQMGCYNLTCLKDCKITGKGWSVDCIDRRFMTRHYVMPMLLVSKAFDFNRRIDVTNLHMALPELRNRAPLPPLETDVALLWAKPIKHLEFKGSNWGNILSLLNVCLIMVIVVGLSAVCLKLRFGQIRMKCWTRRNMEPTTEAMPLNDRPHNDKPYINTPNTETTTRIWPILPSLSDCRTRATETQQT